MQVRKAVVWLRQASLAAAVLASTASLWAASSPEGSSETSDDAAAVIRIGGSAHQPEASATDTKTQDAAQKPTPSQQLKDDGGAAASAIATDLTKLPDEPAAADAADGRAKAQDTPSTAAKSDEPLKPIPAAADSDPLSVGPASFKGVTPGTTTAAEVEKVWGPAKESRKHDGVLTQLFALPPFDRVEVSFVDDKATSIIIRLNRAFPAAGVAEQLELGRIRPVLVSDDVGEILGQSYPERGVLFAFEPSNEPPKPSMNVNQIILEPVTAEPFVLRAETNMESDIQSSAQDLEQALKLQPNNAKALWLYSHVLTVAGEHEKALIACSDAVRREPDNPRYHVSRAQILGQLGRLSEATDEATKAVESGKSRPHVQARAMCLLGDFAATAAKPDYKLAMQFHVQAIKAADPLANDSHPAIRIAAKEVLIDAHLGAAHDIAWGDWKDKETAVTKWLDRAAGLAEDLVKSDNGSREQLLRVSARALAVCVGMHGKLDPSSWSDDAIRVGNEVIAATTDRVHKAQLQWYLGMALYDSVQVCQMRNDHDTALKYGERAIEYLEQSEHQKESVNAAYQMGRLYFRLGAIHAVREQNHRAAITWFDKAVPLLEKPLPKDSASDLGRHGESFVSMAVSYWETGQREKAVQLTESGVHLMETAVSQGSLAETALAIPYGNLASMHRQLGAEATADRYRELAAKSKQSKVK